jgi:nucleotide-binding universal stress UspA family protein
MSMNTLNRSLGAYESSLRIDGMKFKRVLVAVDFRSCTLRTLQYAKTLADKLNAVVEVLHVIQFKPSRDMPAAPRAGLIRAMNDAVRQELKKLVGILWDSEIEAAVKVREGLAHEVILREAADTNAELIIMGTRKHNWLSGVLRRNTVKHVMQDALCPVMVLKTETDGTANSKPQNEFSFPV